MIKVLFSFILISALYGCSHTHQRDPASDSVSVCRQGITPFLDGESSVYGSVSDLLEKEIIPRKGYDLVKSGRFWQHLVSKNASSVEEEEYGFAVITMLKEKYRSLNNKDIARHYKALMAFECG